MLIYSGAGGVDAQNWAKMLLRMYERYAEKEGLKTQLFDITETEDDGTYGVCVFNNGSFGWEFYEEGDTEMIEFDVMDSLILDRVEIVGNIHEATK